MAARRVPFIEQIARHVSFMPDGCWWWLGARCRGYGRITVDGTQYIASRYFYEAFVGEIPDGMQIDHLCSTPWCVNPDHLEAVTPQTNALRGRTLAAENAAKAHCPQGHAYAEWAYSPPSVGRRRLCRACHRERALLYYHARKAA